jgi:hypothetical protein
MDGVKENDMYDPEGQSKSLGRNGVMQRGHQGPLAIVPSWGPLHPSLWILSDIPDIYNEFVFLLEMVQIEFHLL